ncbi:MAG: U32 family peptidase [Candidatus Aminicenantes bacterium]|jgi:collagenase-like PrtC family protease
MKYFSMPADFNKETIDKYQKLNRLYDDSRVIETYGNITVGNIFGSGRSVELLPAIDMEELQGFVAYSKSRGIDFNYTLNASHLQNKEFTRKGILEIMAFLGSLYQAGIRSLTVTLPSLMEIVQASKYDFKIKASVICQITNANRALTYKNLGMERIVTDESLNKNFKELKRVIDTFGNNVEIIVNSICYKNCTHRMFHYNQISTDSVEVVSDASANYYSHRCLLRRHENVGNLLKLTWIRPEDLHYYTGIGIRYFKFQGRQTVVKGDPARAVECYFKESYDGDLMELIDLFNPTSHFRVSIDNKCLDGYLEPFFQKEDFCSNDCRSCNYCESFARKCLDAKKVEEIHADANDFFHQYDPFKQLLDSINNEKTGEKERNDLTVDFDLD